MLRRFRLRDSALAGVLTRDLTVVTTAPCEFEVRKKGNNKNS